MNTTPPITSPPSGYVPAKDALAGRVILVTGASGAIGRAAALACAAHGATVALLARRARPVAEVYDTIVALGGPEPAQVPLDLATATATHFDTLAGSIGESLGRLDGIVHAAGMHPGLATLEQHDLPKFGETLQVNLHGPTLLTRACLPLLREAPAASIVFLTDRYGRKGQAYWGAYAIAKAGIECLTQVLADELEGNTAVRVNALYPGPVESILRGAVWPGEQPAHVRSGTSVSGALLWLLDDASADVTGCSLDAAPPPETLGE